MIIIQRLSGRMEIKLHLGAPNIEFYEIEPPLNPKKNENHGQDQIHMYCYSIRDYGNRVGHMRQMDYSISIISGALSHFQQLM